MSEGGSGGEVSKESEQLCKACDQSPAHPAFEICVNCLADAEASDDRHPAPKEAVQKFRDQVLSAAEWEELEMSHTAREVLKALVRVFDISVTKSGP